MKNLIFALGLLLSASSLAAQAFVVGPKAGFNLNFWSSTYNDIGARLSFHVGGFGEVEVGERVSARAELLFSNIGASNKDEDDPGRIVLHTVALPLLFSYRPAPAIALHGGVQPSYILNAKTVITEGSDEGTYDNDEVFGAIDFAVVLGVEYALDPLLRVGARLQLGLNNVLDRPGDDEVRNRVVQIYAAAPVAGGL